MSDQDTGEIVQSEAEAAIDHAYHVENDPAKANALYQKLIGSADREGEQALVGSDEGDGAESLPDIGPSPDGEWTFDRPEVVAHQFKMMEASFGELATDLRDDWGADAGRNMEFAAAASREFETHYPEIISTVTARGAANDPLVVELLAVLGRQWAETPGDPSTVRLFPNTDGHEQETAMNETNIDFDEKVETLMNEQDQAQQAGNIAKRDRIERQLRGLFVRKYGTGPAVGEGGRTL